MHENNEDSDIKEADNIKDQSEEIVDSREMEPAEHQDDSPPQTQYEPLPIDTLPELIQAALHHAGWTELTPVQSAALPVLIERRDALVQAKTGSGKTGAFLLPLIERIDPIEIDCQALILVPTRELAIQVVKEGEVLLHDTGVEVVPVYGGVRYEKQIKAFREGAQIIVGTPGRILDHLQSGNLRLDSLQVLIFDEADRMLSMGFYQDMLALKAFLPEHPVQTCMFSATFPVTVRSLASQFVSDHEFLNLSTDNIAADAVQHVAFVVEPTEKDQTLYKLLQMENPEGAIIFCNTKNKVNYVTTVLQRNGFDADYLTSDLPQNAREKVLDQIRSQKLKILVATDVAARGIDIPHLSHSIQFELPEDLEVYIHRAGRTGRAGASGTAYAIVSGVDELLMYKLIKKYNIKFEQRDVPTSDAILDATFERLKEMVAKRVEGRDRYQVDMAQKLLPLVKRAGEDEEVAAVLAWIVNDYLYLPAVDERLLKKPIIDRDRKGNKKGKGDKGKSKNRGRDEKRSKVKRKSKPKR